MASDKAWKIKFGRELVVRSDEQHCLIFVRTPSRKFEQSGNFGGAQEETIHAIIDIPLDVRKEVIAALLARDDARIARLEDVAKKVRELRDVMPKYQSLDEVSRGQLAVIDVGIEHVLDALADLDADAPGGG